MGTTRSEPPDTTAPPTGSGAGPAADAPARRARAAVVLTVLLLAALVAEVAATVAVGGTSGRPGALPYWYGGGWVLFAAALGALRRVPRRWAGWLVGVGGVALALAGLVQAPRTSTDMFRYAWDGRVQAAGISPYAYPPDDPHLVSLRDSWLFPPRGPGGSCSGWTPLASNGPDAGGCTRLNRPAVHTIYPPVAEGWFLAVHALSPPGTRHKPMQTGGALLAVATTGALLLAQRRRGADPRAAALWAWCPLVPVAAVNDAHVDTLGVLLTVLGLAVAARPVRRGALLGAAVAVKLLPALGVPGELAARGTRARLRTLAPALAVIALSYLPYVVTSGAGVLGYLPGYLHEEGYEPGHVRRFALLRLVLPQSAAGPAAIAGVVAVTLWVLWRGDPRRPWSGALLVTGTSLLLTSPAYYWYALLVVALVALDGRWEWLGVPLAGLALYTADASGGHGLAVQAVPYGLAALAVIAGAAMRTAAHRKMRVAPLTPPRGA